MEDKIMLNDLLKFTDDQIENVKVRLNRHNGVDNPIEKFKSDPESLLEWNYWNNKTYKIGQMSVGLVNMGNDKWLLFTVGKITNTLDIPKNTGVGVEYETLEQYKSLFGRVIINYHNTNQQLFRDGESILKDLEIIEILPSIFTGFDFPGYDNVTLTFSELETIVKGNCPSYKNALENQKAVYLQTDMRTGKLYVGSATAENGMLLARWTNYINNGHGGNKLLKKLVDKEGFDYIKNNFRYTIIENYNAKVDDKIILNRENYWKTVLASKNNGYNAN